MKLNKVHLTIAAVAAGFALFCSFIVAQNKPTFYLIGDSTVKNGQDDGQRKGPQGQWGWGHYIHEYFDSTKINIENDALGGTSSRTFYNRKDLWGKVLGKIKAGDYLIIQFGTNDASAINDSTRARGTIRGNGEEVEEIDNILTKQHEVVHSYGWYVRQFVTLAKAKGATVIVCPPVPKNSWTDGKVHRNADSYGKWAAEAAQQSGAFYIDLNKILCDQYDAEGEEHVKATYYGADATHTIEAGARVATACVIKGIRSLPDLKLNDYLLNK
jgi:lysophospholipase L1-like esterase